MTFVPKVAFIVAGEPLPKERPRSAAGQKQSFTPKKTRDAEKRIADAFKATHPNFEPLTGRLMFIATFYRETRRRVDVDNLYKLVTDALNKVAFVDDEQIDKSQQERIYGAGDDARTIIRIYEKQEVPVSGNEE